MSKFKEKGRQAVFTTVYIIRDNSPITNVFHYQDGSWQFNGNEVNLKESDYKVISLDEILSIDKTIEELSNMPVQFHAKRNNKKSKWILEPIEDSQ